jgi:hypothetical protein
LWRVDSHSYSKRRCCCCNISTSVHGLVVGLHLCLYPLALKLLSTCKYCVLICLNTTSRLCVCLHHFTFLIWISFDRGDFTRDIVTPAFGVSWVGGVMAMYSAMEAIVS